MKVTLAMVVMTLIAVPVFAQAPVATPVPPDVQQYLQSIQQVGCNAEVQASAQALAALKKENESLKAQIQKLDPPKSGATKK